MVRRFEQKVLQARASSAAFWGSGSMLGPGAVQERIAVEMPVLAHISSSRDVVQGGMYQPEGSPPLRFRASV